MLEGLIHPIRGLLESPYFTREEEHPSKWQVFVWWEKRRIRYNGILAIVGTITLIISFLSSIVGDKYLGVPVGFPDPPIVSVLAVITYAVIANICYAGGWITEIVVKEIWGDEANSFGKISFVLGLLFSILATLFPSVVVVISLCILLIEKYY